MTLPGWIILACVLWAVWAVISWRLEHNPRRDPFTGLAYYFTRWYARWRHHLRVQGAEHLPKDASGGPLIVVCNHTAGLDPILVQCVCPAFIRWLMATDMQWDEIAEIWQFLDIIGVARGTRDTKALREAIRHVRAGGVLGIFPEGKIARPRGIVLPFHTGVGMIVASTHAPVMPIYISGTPDSRTAWGSLSRTSHSRLLVGALMRWPSDTKPEAIAQELERWFRRQSVNRGTNQVDAAAALTPRSPSVARSA